MIAAVSVPKLGTGNTAAVLGDLLTAGARADALWLLEQPERVDALMGVDLRYVEPSRSTVLDFASAPEIIRRGWAGCAGAARVYAAIWIADGTDAIVEVQPRGIGGDYHAVVRFPCGRIYDPSRELKRT